MRVALIASSLRLAGAEKQFVYMARALFEAGIDTRVFYLGRGDHYQAVLSGAGIPLEQIFQPNRPLLMLARLIKALRTFKPHVVLTSQFGDLIFAAPAGHLCNAFVLGGVRSDGFYELRTSARRSWFSLKLCHGLIANSWRAKENLASKGVNPRKIAVLPNVIDLADFDRRAAMALPDDLPARRIQIAAVGSLQKCKRFDRFLAGLALARRHEPAVCGVIAGKDLGEKAPLQKKAAAWGLSANDLQFLGECDYVPALLARSRMLVLCSEYEGFPNVILEAMAARLPVLTTPAGDAARIVEDGKTGYVLEPEDAGGMADCIVELARNPALAAQMGEAGRNRVEHDYNFTSLAARLLFVFSEFARQQSKNSIVKMLEQTAALNSCAPLEFRPAIHSYQ